MELGTLSFFFLGVFFLAFRQRLSFIGGIVCLMIQILKLLY